MNFLVHFLFLSVLLITVNCFYVTKLEDFVAQFNYEGSFEQCQDQLRGHIKRLCAPGKCDDDVYPLMMDDCHFTWEDEYIKGECCPYYD